MKQEQKIYLKINQLKFPSSNHGSFSSSHPDFLKLLDDLRRGPSGAGLAVAGGDLLEEPLGVWVGAQQRPL